MDGNGSMGGANVGAGASGAGHQNLTGWNQPAHSLGGGTAPVEDVDLLNLFSEWM